MIGCISGCKTLIWVDVSVYHRLDLYKNYEFSIGSVQDYRIKQRELGINEYFVENVNSIQHENYGYLIIQELTKHNFTLDNENPDFKVVSSYFIDRGQQKQIIRFVRHTSSKEHTRILRLIIFEDKTNKNIYETEIISNGPTPQLQKVIPLLIKGMFDGYPRNSGETFPVSVPFS